MKYLATFPDGTSTRFDAPGDGGALDHVFETSPLARAEGACVHALPPGHPLPFTGVMLTRDEALEQGTAVRVETP